ncbi:S-4TM family putative pore-forming effector [Streptomyces albogriseolus]|uniref:S-4TM family putative pore-forming effector n=1 Tax=Streptomyces albogriseolus TaxID=1887 RepID=UPI003CE70563
MTAAQPPSEPSGIAARQNEPYALDLLDAYSHRYETAARWRRASMLGSYGLALVSPVLSTAWPNRAQLIGAVAALWLVLGRALLAWLDDSYCARAAGIQEVLDTHLFRLPWNEALAGRKDRVQEDIAELAPHRHRPNHRNWYDTDDMIPRTADVLLCQLQSVAWGRRNHRAYMSCLLAAAGFLLVFDTAWGVARHMSLYDFLVTLFLPTAPALLDLVQLIRGHWEHGENKGRVEDNIRSLLKLFEDGEGDTVAPDACRRVQDAIYQLRRTGPRIPARFYRNRRRRDQGVISDGVADVRERIRAATTASRTD